MGLYGEKHAARERAVDRAFDALLHLLEQDGKPVFNFVDGEVVFANQRLRELQGWKWASELTSVTVERIEITAGVGREEFQRFLGEVGERLNRATGSAIAGPRQIRAEEFPHIHFGQLSVGERNGGEVTGLDSLLALKEEAEATDWLMGQAAQEAQISSSVAGAVVQSLSVALHQERDVLELLVPLKEIDQYTTVHSMNTAMLTMALAESLGFAGVDVKAIGEAALLHDLGKTRIPAEIIQKPGKLSSAEWKIMMTHPAEGARILVNSGPEMELAAIVAYEHHMKYDGGGYPAVRHERRLHHATELIQVVDVYDALRTRRPFRDPWPIDRVVSHLKEESGKSFHPDAVELFLGMLSQSEEDSGMTEAASVLQPPR